VADPPDAGLSRRWAVRGRDGTRRAQRGREYPARPARRAAPRRVCGGRPVRCAAAPDAFDELAAQAVLDRLLADLSVPAVLRDVVLPYLADLGERWQRGTASVATEHFASNLIRGRLAGLARGWGAGTGRRPCSPACPPARRAARYGADGFRHRAPPQRLADRLLGASTPVEEPERAAGASHPGLAVLAAARAEALEPLPPELAALARRAPLALTGASSTAQIATAAGARLMAGDPVTEAERAGSSR
jgi:MerR family transcriptional regulator, light-induced transcriptional regulator